MPVVQSDPQIADEFLTREEAAAFLTLKAQTLAAWAVAGRGPEFCKLGRAVRYRRSALERYVQQSTVSGNTDAR